MKPNILRSQGMIGLFLFLFFVNSSILFISYRSSEKKILQATRERLESVAEMSSKLLDIKAYSVINDKIFALGSFDQIDSKSKLLFSESDVEKMESSDEFKKISDQLNIIREAEKDIVLYSYIIIPTSDENTARFTVDADLLEDRKTGADEMVSGFSVLYDISDLPLIKKAFAEKKTVSDSSFRYDKDYDIWALMCFSPIYNTQGRFCGLLGLDISDKKYSASISDLKKTYYISSVIVLIISILGSISVISFTRAIYSQNLKLRENLEKKTKQLNDANADLMDLQD
ncbi:MAG: hypothetical protein KA015_00885 [Spirochaetes bacterium]|nr:hypothetical protein [Spirochaetota bacterium]MBP9023440.1 hypothetical protein [Spirochaetota bacterium]